MDFSPLVPPVYQAYAFHKSRLPIGTARINPRFTGFQVCFGMARNY